MTDRFYIDMLTVIQVIPVDFTGLTLNMLDSINCVSLSQNDQFILTASKDGTISAIKNIFNLTTITVSGRYQYNSHPIPFSHFQYFIAKKFADANEDHLLFKKMLIQKLTRLILSKDTARACEIIRAYPELTIIPRKFNAFHLCSLIEANNPLYIHECIESKVEFLLDLENKTPLHYLLESASPDHNRINMILSECESLIQNNPQVSQILRNSKDLLFKLIKLDNPNVAKFFKCLTAPASIEVSSLVPSFGKILCSSKKAFEACNSLTPQQEDLVNMNRIIETEKGNSSIHLSYLRIPLNTDPLSCDMMNLMFMMVELNCDEIFQTKASKILSEYMWINSRAFVRVVSLIYVISLIHFSAYVGLRESNLAMEIVDFSFAVYLCLYEIIKFSVCPISYTRDLWNFFNIFAASLRTIIYFLIWSHANNQVKSWLVSFALFFGYLKLISCLRLFKATSN